MTNTLNVPANAAPMSFRAAPAPVSGPGWTFLPASRFSASRSHANPARHAATRSADALRDMGQTAWAGQLRGVWGTFVSTAS